MVIFYALMAAFSFGSADFLGGFSSRKNSSIAAVVWTQTTGLITVLILAPLMGANQVTGSDIIWGMAGGISGALGLLVLFQGLSTGTAAIVSPLAALAGAAFPVLFGFLTGERPPVITWTGVALSLPAILLLSWEKEDKNENITQSLQLGLLAGALFAAFFIFLSKTSENSGMWPLVASRFITTPLFILIAVIRKTELRLEMGTHRLTILSGILDMAANAFYMLAVRTGYLIFAVILSSLYPAPTVILQKIFIHERLTKMRIAGLILSIAGAALIGVGG